MIKEAIYHRIDSEYCYCTGEDSVTLRLRCAKNDLQSCSVLFGNRVYPKEEIPLTEVVMQKTASGTLFDYYEASVHPGFERMFYFFKISDGTETLWYYQSEFHSTGKAHRNRYYQLPFILREECYNVPEWAHKAVMYQIFPDSFATGKGEHKGLAAAQTALKKGERQKEKEIATEHGISKTLHGGTFKGITENVQWLKGLGINCVYLNPVFAAVSYHKYDTNDYKHVDPCFGTDEEFRTLVEVLHDNGIRVILDGVFNHSGTGFFAWQDILKNQEKSTYRSWYYDITFPVKDWKSEYTCFAYVKSMPKLNLNDPDAASYFAEVGKYWICEYGVDGWRLDVANEVNKNFWRKFRNAVRSAKSDALLIAEVWEDAQNWQTYDLFDSAMNYRFTYACADFLAHRSIGAKEFGERFSDMLMRYPSPVSSVQMNLLDSHDVERFLYTCGGEVRRQKLAAAVQMTFPGMPSIFAGDERAMNGKTEAEYRLPFLWPKNIEQDKERDDMTNWYRMLIHLRHKKDALTSSSIAFHDVQNSSILAYTRGLDCDPVLVLINNDDAVQKGILPFPLSAAIKEALIIPDGFTVDQILTLQTHKPDGSVTLQGQLPVGSVTQQNQLPDCCVVLPPLSVCILQC